MIGRDDDVREIHYLTHIVQPRGSRARETIKAWSWDKTTCNFYEAFHRSKNLKRRSMTGTVEELSNMLEEYTRCEIAIARIKTRDPKHHNKAIDVYVPATEEELSSVRSHCNSACMDMIRDYQVLQDLFYKLKDKYQDALRLLLFEEMMRAANMQPNMISGSIYFDEVKILVYDHPDDFGD